MSRRVLVLTLVTVSAACAARSLLTASAQEPAGRSRKVVKTDEEWQKLLSRPQYEVTRHKATEPPYSGKYANSHTKGTYLCVCCGAPLFSSVTKFESGTGWPSFYRPVSPKAVDTAPDFETGERRVEVMCNDCGAHLGHVFDDGPAPTGLRYCMNSLSLKLVPATAARKGATGKTRKGQAPAPPDSGAEDPTQAGDAKPSESRDSAAR